jgi:hypothetical protein
MKEITGRLPFAIKNPFKRSLASIVLAFSLKKD